MEFDSFIPAVRAVRSTKRGSGAPITAEASMDMYPGSSEPVAEHIGEHTLTAF